MAIDLPTFWMLLRVFPSVNIARAAAIAVAMTWNFWLNRSLTFSHARTRYVAHQYSLFCLGNGLGAILSWTVWYLLTTQVPFFAQHTLYAAVLGIGVSAISNFIMSKHVAFR